MKIIFSLRKGTTRLYESRERATQKYHTMNRRVLLHDCPILDRSPSRGALRFKVGEDSGGGFLQRPRKISTTECFRRLLGRSDSGENVRTDGPVCIGSRLIGDIRRAGGFQEGVVILDRERMQPLMAYFQNCSILNGRESVDGVFSRII